MAEIDKSGCQDHLDALRHANDGWAITVWKDGGWKLWTSLDAAYAECEPDWLSTLRGSDIHDEMTKLAATDHKMEAWTVQALPQKGRQ